VVNRRSRLVFQPRGGLAKLKGGAKISLASDNAFMEIPMRFFLAVAVLTLALASPTWAQQDITKNFGKVNCPQPVPCPGSTTDAPLSASALSSIANTCIANEFGRASPSGGFFDDATGLDASNCLSVIPGAFPKGVGAQLTPSCCVMPRPNNPNICTLHCELNVAQ
jgi:hypothetical protein